VFRRRKSKDQSQQFDEDGYVGEEYDEEAAVPRAGGGGTVGGGAVSEGARQQREPQEARVGGGPWDAAEPFPERDRVDLGSLRVPVGPDYEIQLFMGPEHGAWVTARRGESELQMQAFAASRSDSLWDDVRAEIAAEVQAAGGSSMEQDGTFGIVLVAQVPVQPGEPASGMRTVRFVGVDGPRWFLRGLFGGPAAESPADADAELLEGVFRDVVVSRGDHPVPPRDLLELRLPPDAQQALQEQMAAQQEDQEEEQETRFRADLNPFERGPEFTETR
jgi:Protein of unknown function (DUF3710)